MVIGIIGKKRGMTRVFTEDGCSVPVTVIQAKANRIVRLMSLEKDGYQAVQVTWGSKKPKKMSKPMAGIYTKANIKPGEGLTEFRINGVHKALAEDSEINVDDFTVGQRVDVSGTTIGKGYSGVIKRHNFRHQRNSHGNSRAHRAPGSIGQCQTPGRVFKGKKMAGQMGNKKRTARNLEIVSIDSERHLILIKGSIPGTTGGRVIVRPSVKTHV